MHHRDRRSSILPPIHEPRHSRKSRDNENEGSDDDDGDAAVALRRLLARGRGARNDDTLNYEVEDADVSATVGASSWVRQQRESIDEAARVEAVLDGRPRANLTAAAAAAAPSGWTNIAPVSLSALQYAEDGVISKRLSGKLSMTLLGQTGGGGDAGGISRQSPAAVAAKPYPSLSSLKEQADAKIHMLQMQQEKQKQRAQVSGMSGSSIVKADVEGDEEEDMDDDDDDGIGWSPFVVAKL